MRVLNKSRICASATVIMLIIIFYGTTTVISDDFMTVVNINPSNKTVSSGETFSVEIYCIPDQPIKSFEFKLSFDASLLEAVSVTEGDIFNDYDTFFSSGTINNADGIIDGIYNLVIGPGNVSNPETFVMILFSAKVNTGTSIINLYDIGVTNETGYVSISVDDGYVTVEGANSEPDDPGMPNGPTNRNVYQSGSYNTNTTDPDGDQVQYRFDWDAGGYHDYSEWTSLVDSGQSASKFHSWDATGTYVVKTQAKDEYGATSEWSSGFTVIVSEIPNNDLIISSPNPANGSTNVPISTASLSINIQDPDGDTFNYTISTSPNIGNSSGNESSNGSKSCNISDLEYSTTYTWYVSCMDTGSGNWTNKSYWFTTESNGGDDEDEDYPGGGGGLPPVGNDDNLNDTTKQNNPPETPVKPSGPTFIEMDVGHTFTSSTYDVDGDEIRYQFDWGDGNYSNWSDFMSSNTSVSMSHHWNLISNYSVRLMAQDENGVNSSWSTALNITVSQAESGEIPPVADINVSSNASANQTIVFNASGSYDIDGVIVSYQWDFGDGTTGSGVSPEYVYKHPGKYSVTLIVTDNNGNTYSKTMTVNVASEAKEGQSKEQDVLLFHFGIIFVGVIVFIIGVLAVFFIDNVKSFFSEHHIYQFLHRVILHNERKIEKTESKIEKTKMSTNTYQGENILPNKITSETNFKRLSIVKMSSHYDEIQKNYIEDGCEDKLSYEGNAFSDYSHEVHTDEKIERIATNGVRPDESSVEIKDSVFSSIRDIELMVDNLILSNIKEKCSIEENDMFDASIDIIRKNIDNMSSKKQE